MQVLSRIGTRVDSSYLDRKRIYMVNIIAIICVIPSFSFSVLNFIEDRFYLSLINFLTGVTYITVILLQYYHQHQKAKALLIGSSYILFSISRLFYRNGGEYFLVSTLIVSMLLYDNIRFLIFGSIIIISTILMIYAFPITNYFNFPVPQERAIYNITSSLIFMVVAVVFFKHVMFHDKKQIELQRLKLEEMNIEKEKIFSIIAHDMRAPLVNTSIIVDIFEENTINKKNMSDFITQLKKQINDQNKVLESILAWSSNRIKGVSSALTNVSIYDLTTEILKDFHIHYTRKRINFNINIDKEIFILADFEHLKIILRNIISNAIKFSYPDTQIKIYTTQDSKKSHVHIEDIGVGIDMSKFDASFKRIKSRSLGTSNEPGSGIGLLFCKELAELNNGQITIKSTPKKGSIFTLSFPLVYRKIDDAPTDDTIVQNKALFV
ncbi:sensor histidine kinase [Sphingobacterium bovistauri]|uniref:histidine kinase n=1 Tax=Sphingobacterium bovistauri TaxID=2781959 RepID=A0ABS7Z096_9SPHI|nr:HAMP domain-containing sensor histidine kinase [Sphingobacterium bovistauri]MCA5003591.1 HAMP domain-containing histidine kinase [Sphingobacterium bovistauri]